MNSMASCVRVFVPFLVLFVATVSPLAAQEWDKPTEETHKLTPSDGAADDQFGSAVAVRGGVAIVGALFDDDDGASSGSAYVFRYDRTEGEWVEVVDGPQPHRCRR